MCCSKEERVKRVLNEYSDYLENIDDLLASDEPGFLFDFMMKFYGDLLNPDSYMLQSSRELEIRKKINKLFKLLGPKFLKSPQVIENRNNLKNPNDYTEDKGIVLPDSSTIWAMNHSFHDDALATVLAIPRNAYILFGSLPQFYNTLDGFTAALNGVVIINRKSNESKRKAMVKSADLLSKGTDLIVCPEGVWNKSPNQLLLNFWPGIYRLAKETGTSVIPVVHYISDKSQVINPKQTIIHTVVDDPIQIANMNEKEGLECLRDTMATWYYLMMERYGKSTRDAEVGDFADATSAWEEKLRLRLTTATRYDKEIELCADYVPSYVVSPQDAFEQVAEIATNSNNVSYVESAKKIVKEYKNNNFQRRF